MQVLFDIPNFFCIMQLRAENQNLVSALSNYQQILYQFFDFTQNLKQSPLSYLLNFLTFFKLTHCHFPSFLFSYLPQAPTTLEIFKTSLAILIRLICLSKYTLASYNFKSFSFFTVSIPLFLETTFKYTFLTDKLARIISLIYSHLEN